MRLLKVFFGYDILVLNLVVHGSVAETDHVRSMGFEKTLYSTRRVGILPMAIFYGKRCHSKLCLQLNAV